MNYTSERVIEGQSVTLCCSSDSRPPTLDIWWVMKGRVLCRNYDTVVLCHEITNISRVDSGSYKCFAENEVETVDDEVVITVLCKYEISVVDIVNNATFINSILKRYRCICKRRLFLITINEPQDERCFFPKMIRLNIRNLFKINKKRIKYKTNK